MSKNDIKAIIKDLKKNELTELISVAQEVLSTLFNSSEIRDNVKESRFSKGYECPKCQSTDTIKNGTVRGVQRFKCKNCKYNFVLTDKRTTKELTILKALSTLINALGDIPYDELEELLNRDRSQLHRWNKASEMREHRPKRLDHCKIPHDELGTYVAAHQGLFDSSLPIFAAASSIIEREFSVKLIVQRKYVVDYE